MADQVQIEELNEELELKKITSTQVGMRIETSVEIKGKDVINAVESKKKARNESHPVSVNARVKGVANVPRKSETELKNTKELKDECQKSTPSRNLGSEVKTNRMIEEIFWNDSSNENNILKEKLSVPIDTIGKGVATVPGRISPAKSAR